MIAEVGINHNGDLTIAKRLVDAAVEAGADAVKFQKRKLSETYRQEILDEPRHGEQGLQYIVPMLVEFELSDEQFRALFAYCEAAGGLRRSAHHGIAPASTFSRRATSPRTRSARPT